MSSGGVVRGILVGLVVTVISLFFSKLSVHNYLVLISVVVLTAVLFSLGGFLNGMFAQKFDDVSIVPTFILTPLTYLGGIFYSIRLLPEFWQGVSHANPILYMNQRLPLRLPRHIGHQPRRFLRHHIAVHRGVVRPQLEVAEQWLRHPHLRASPAA